MRGKGLEFQSRGGGFQQVLQKGEVPWSGSDRVCSKFIPRVFRDSKVCISSDIIAVGKNSI